MIIVKVLLTCMRHVLNINNLICNEAIRKACAVSQYVRRGNCLCEI